MPHIFLFPSFLISLFSDMQLHFISDFKGYCTEKYSPESSVKCCTYYSVCTHTHIGMSLLTKKKYVCLSGGERLTALNAVALHSHGILAFWWPHASFQSIIKVRGGETLENQGNQDSTPPSN